MKSKSAASSDGWGVTDLKQLTDLIFIKLVTILNTIGEGDEWPEATLEAIVALLPKDEEAPLAVDPEVVPVELGQRAGALRPVSGATAAYGVA